MHAKFRGIPVKRSLCSPAYRTFYGQLSRAKTEHLNTPKIPVNHRKLCCFVLFRSIYANTHKNEAPDFSWCGCECPIKINKISKVYIFNREEKECVRKQPRS